MVLKMIFYDLKYFCSLIINFNYIFFFYLCDFFLLLFAFFYSKVLFVGFWHIYSLNLILLVYTNLFILISGYYVFSFYLFCFYFYSICWICIRIRNVFLLSSFIFWCFLIYKFQEFFLHISWWGTIIFLQNY